MTQASNNEVTLGDIEVTLGDIDQRLSKIEQELKEVTLADIGQRLSKIEQELRETNNKVETYQKASTQVVNLAFSLIASATVTLIITSVLRK
ncbi:hypothetical protein F7734_55660 [Scytonema sp. UIC 10036]|uniref:hypothetical protein n=1 Tax=Scytonema sp. UIC 10036 TaxID=2304196 RepID=UPI0012DAC0EC|nr:hypothetical protein [Scytonema sp. UIC 10036]MUH01019.1 hypothetical protein [Scytonema sp. UIC 10036]